MIILPWLSGFPSPRKAPMTWLLVAANVTIFLACLAQKIGVETKMDKIQTDAYIASVANTYEEYLKTQNDDDSKQAIEKSKDLSKGKSAAYFYILAIQDKNLWANEHIVTGTLLEPEWKTKLEPMKEVMSKMPYRKFGLSREDISLFRFFSHMFIHAGWMHLLGNMFFLLMFGGVVEAAFGSVPFALMYLGSGLLAAFAYLMAPFESMNLMIGASGAISGIMGIWLPLYFSRDVAYLYAFLPLPIRGVAGKFIAPAWLSLIIWNLHDVTGVIVHKHTDGVAYAAHVGGFVCGLLAGGIFKKYFDGEKEQPENPQKSLTAAPSADNLAA